MFVTDEDRNKFYRFIYKHLNLNGYALICAMGDGKFETQSDIRTASDIVERQNSSAKMMVPAASRGMVSFKTLERELQINGFKIIEQGSSPPDFNSLMYVAAERVRAGLFKILKKPVQLLFL